MSKPIRLRSTIALLFGIGLAAFALAESVSADLHIPAARILAAECQGFEALATAGGKPLSCNAPLAAGDLHGAASVVVFLATATTIRKVVA